MHTALILFARSAAEETRHKNILPAHAYQKQQAVFEHLNQSAEKLLASTGLPYFIISSQQQSDNNVGERFYNALKKVFQKGCERILVRGNDCLQLKPADITQAAKQFTQSEVVLGPCVNGGIYL